MSGIRFEDELDPEPGGWEPSLLVRLVLIVGVLLGALVLGRVLPKPAAASQVEHRTACAPYDLERHGDRVALYVHGGGWTEGSRRGGLELDVSRILRAEGWSIATTDYRFGAWSDLYADVTCTVADLRREFSTVVAWGNSAGGHIVTMLAVDALVDRAVNISGPIDLRVLDWLPEGVFPDLDAASPALRSGGSPVLLVIGDHDHLVPLDQIMESRYPAVIVKGQGHQLRYPAEVVAAFLSTGS